jgi:hypothetical protein
MEEQLWYEYLDIINTMCSYPGMYHLDQKRTKIHEGLAQTYIEQWDNFIPERFDEICHNLGLVIDFNPPLEPYDHIKPYAHELTIRFGYQDLKKYCTGFIGKYSTVTNPK